MCALSLDSYHPCWRRGHHRPEWPWVPEWLWGADSCHPHRPIFGWHNREINLKVLRHWDCGAITYCSWCWWTYKFNFIQLVNRGAGISSLGGRGLGGGSKDCALVSVLEEFTVCHGKTNGYLMRFSGTLECHSRNLHSTQCSLEEAMVSSEDLRKSEPRLGQLTV